MDQINSSEVPLMAMTEFQGAVMGKYVQQLEQKVAKGKKDNKKLKDTLNVVASKRDELQLAEKVQDHASKNVTNKNSRNHKKIFSKRKKRCVI